MGKYIDGSGLSHFMGILKGIHQTFVTNVKWDSSTKKIKQTKNGTDSDVMQFVQGSNVTLTAASGSLTIAATQRALATANPVMDGTAAVGTSSKAAKEDHVHPSDTTRVPTSRKVNDKALSSDITLTGSDISRSSESDTSIATVLDNYDTNFTDIEQGMADIVTGITVDGVRLNGNNKAIRYGTCATAAGTADKVVTLSSPCTLETGLVVYSKFTVTNTAAVANLTLAVTAPTAYDNSATATTTAKPIKYRGANLSGAGVLAANRVYAFVYDGTNWELIGDLDTNSDTKNTAGSTDSSSKLFLIGATSQAANPQTYSQDTVYAGTDGHVYSNSKQAVNLSDTQALTNKTYNGLTLTAASTGFTIAGGTTSKTLTVNNTYTLGAACAKGVDTSIAANSTSTNLPTTKAVVDYIGQVAGALVYKGTVSAESSLLNVALKTGWFYIVTMPNTSTSTVTIGGVVCEAGDMIIVNTAGTYTTSSALGEKIDVVQTNIETLSNSEIDALWTAATAA